MDDFGKYPGTLKGAFGHARLIPLRARVCCVALHSSPAFAGAGYLRRMLIYASFLMLRECYPEPRRGGTIKRDIDVAGMSRQANTIECLASKPRVPFRVFCKALSV